MNKQPSEGQSETEELKATQRDREAAERLRATSAVDEAEAAEHERRAEKAAYLRGKLEDRARSERDADKWLAG